MTALLLKTLKYCVYYNSSFTFIWLFNGLVCWGIDGIIGKQYSRVFVVWSWSFCGLLFFCYIRPYLNVSSSRKGPDGNPYISANFSSNVHKPILSILAEFPATATCTTWRSIISILWAFIKEYVPYLAFWILFKMLSWYCL